jgi:hypothetical protein
MNILLRSLDAFPPVEIELFYREKLVPQEQMKMMVLLSATCVGNDAKSCPLFHGSLAPMIFSRIKFDGREREVTRRVRFRLQLFLLQSNNITWINHISFLHVSRHPDTTVNALSQKRYIAASVKSVEIPDICLQVDQYKSFFRSCCPRIEEICIHITFRCFRDEWVVYNDILEFLSKFTLLTKVDFCYYGSYGCSSFTHVGIQHLTKLRLKVLHLGVIAFFQDDVDKCIKAICSITSLEDLIPPHDSVFNSNVHYLTKLPRLQKLHLNWSTISNKGLRQIASIRTLKSLALTRCDNLTDDGYRHLVHMIHLEELCLNYSYSVTAACLEHLLGCPSLRFVTVNDCSPITDDELTLFHKKLRARQLENAKQLAASGARRERE